MFMTMSLTGCFTDFEPKLESTPVICINSKIAAGEDIIAEVTRTWRYSEGDPNVDGYPHIWLEDADVSLYVNGEFEEKMTFVADTLWANRVNRYFKAAYIPQIGDDIKITVNDKTYGEAEAEVTIPQAVKINNVDYQILDLNKRYDDAYNKESYTIEVKFYVNFTDPAKDVNYYLFEMYVDHDGSTYDHYSGNETLTINPDYNYEPIFSEHITPIETVISDALGLYTMFSDRQISGRDYSLTIPVTVEYTIRDYLNNETGEINVIENKCEITLRLCHISTSYYNYMLSLWSATEGVSGALGDIGLGDAVFEFSNVSTGAGIIAAMSYSEFTISMEDLISTEVSTN